MFKEVSSLNIFDNILNKFKNKRDEVKKKKVEIKIITVSRTKLFLIKDNYEKFNRKKLE